MRLIKGRDMNRTAKNFASVATLAAVIGLIAAIPASAATPSYPLQKGYYGKRYCELMLVKLQSNPLLHVEVWNSYGLNDCPTNAWGTSVTTAGLQSIATANGMDSVAINGPRWWTFDQAGAIIGTNIKTLGSVQMRQFAVLDLAAPPVNWTGTTVQRTTTFIWNKGTYSRVLTAPDGHKYLMQSYTTMVSSKVTEKSLNTLASGSKPLMKLPAGWSYKATKLTKQFKLVAGGTMTVLQDNLKNSYSQIS